MTVTVTVKVTVTVTVAVAVTMFNVSACLSDRTYLGKQLRLCWQPLNASTSHAFIYFPQ